MEKLFYTVSEFCLAYGVSRSKLYLLWKEGSGPALIKMGSRTLIAKTDAAKWASDLPRINSVDFSSVDSGSTSGHVRNENRNSPLINRRRLKKKRIN